MSHSTLNMSTIKSIFRARVLVALIGSQKNSGWWDCSFMDDTGIKFLANSFPRSAASAAFHSTIEAAQRVHDSALGKIGCYHLFRLPLSIEEHLMEEEISDSGFPSMEDALAELNSMAGAQINAPDGPVQIGVEKRILVETSLSELAAHYHSAFTQGIRCYPYFAADV